MTAPSVSETVKAIDALHEKAAKGPWVRQGYSNHYGYSIWAPNAGCIAERWYSIELADCDNNEMRANSALIVELANHWPAISAALRSGGKAGT